MSYTRLLKRDKPKAHIVKSLSNKFFHENDVEEAVIQIKPNLLTRSGRQNALYRMWVRCLAEEGETGNSEEALHQYLAQTYLSPEVEEVQGKPILVIKSTTKLKVKEMMEYLKCVQEFADDLGILLPHPEELYYDSMGMKRLKD